MILGGEAISPRLPTFPVLDQTELGLVLTPWAIRKGLSDLNPDIHFDMGAALNIWHPRMDEFAGVYYAGRHLAAMDRGWSPEFEVYSTRPGRVEIPAQDASLYEDATIQFRQIPEGDPEYLIGSEKARARDYGSGYAFVDGQLRHHRAYRDGLIRDRIIKCGWRYTLGAVGMRQVPGADIVEIQRKFKVDLLRNGSHLGPRLAPVRFENRLSL